MTTGHPYHHHHHHHHHQSQLASIKESSPHQSLP
jgi:hypothetical protein